MPISPSPKFPLGVYVWNPSATDPAAEASFESAFNTFSSVMGAKPQFMNAFLNYYADWSYWVNDATNTATSWRQSPVLGSVTPVISIPMATGSDFGNQDQVFKDIVAGKHDDVFAGIINAWKSQGYTTIYARIGYEMNGGFMPWYMGDDPTTQADWVAAFQHIADLVHNVQGIDVKTVWNPAQMNWTAQPTVNAYPGDQYVDVIGADPFSRVYPVQLYDWGKNDGTVDSSLPEWFADPVNREHYWMNPNATQWNPNGYDESQWGMRQTLELATAHNKPLGIAEAGAGGDGTTTGPVDDADFPKWLASVLSQPGAPQVEFVNIWNINDSAANSNWTFTDGSKPNEEAAWVQNFGVPDGSGVGSGSVDPPVVGSGADTLILNLSEEAYQGDAQFTVAMDGVQLGGTYTVTALHAAGEEEAFTFKGDWGAGAHIVTVTFLNDAYGGSPDLDRNVYVDSLSYDGASQAAGAIFYREGAQNFAVGGNAASVSFVDDQGHRFSAPIIPGGTKNYYAGDTGLDGNVYQWTQGAGVVGLGTSSFNLVQVANLVDQSGASYRLSEFAEANVSVSGAPTASGSKSTLELDDAMRGTIALGAGNYDVTIHALSAYRDPSSNTFHVGLGSGTDTFTLYGDPYATQAVLTAGSGTSTMTFIGVQNVNVTGGSGASTVSTGDGTASVTAGPGTMDVTGGAGPDTYIYHAGSGLMTVRDFSAGKGDTLQIDQSLQASLIQTTGPAGVTLGFGGESGGGIVLGGLSSVPSTSIHWV